MTARRNERLRPVEHAPVFPAVKEDNLARFSIEPDRSKERKPRIGSLPVGIVTYLLAGVRLPAEEQPFHIASDHARKPRIQSAIRRATGQRRLVAFGHRGGPLDHIADLVPVLEFQWMTGLRAVGLEIDEVAVHLPGNNPRGGATA